MRSMVALSLLANLPITTFSGGLMADSLVHALDGRSVAAGKFADHHLQRRVDGGRECEVEQLAIRLVLLALDVVDGVVIRSEPAPVKVELLRRDRDCPCALAFLRFVDLDCPRLEFALVLEEVETFVVRATPHVEPVAPCRHAPLPVTHEANTSGHVSDTGEDHALRHHVTTVWLTESQGERAANTLDHSRALILGLTAHVNSVDHDESGPFSDAFTKAAAAINDHLHHHFMLPAGDRISDEHSKCTIRFRKGCVVLVFAVIRAIERPEAILLLFRFVFLVLDVVPFLCDLGSHGLCAIQFVQGIEFFLLGRRLLLGWWWCKWVEHICGSCVVRSRMSRGNSRKGSSRGGSSNLWECKWVQGWLWRGRGVLCTKRVKVGHTLGHGVVRWLFARGERIKRVCLRILLRGERVKRQRGAKR